MAYREADQGNVGTVCESEARYRTLARHFPNGAVILFDRELRYRLVDGAGLPEVGLNRDQMEGRQIREVFPAWVCDVLEPQYRRALAGEEVHFEMDFRGETFEVRVAPVRGESGDIPYGLVMTQRVTERRQTERALRESEARYRVLVESIADAVFVLDEALRFVLINDAGVRFAGKPRGAILGQPLDAAFPDIRSTPFLAAFEKAMRTRRLVQVEGCYEHEDGRECWYEVRIHPAPEGVLCIATDVSRRHEAEEARRSREEKLEQAVSQRAGELAERERYFRTLFEASPLGIVLLDIDGHIRDWNQRWLDFLRIRKENALQGHAFTPFVHPDSRRDWQGLLRQASDDDSASAVRELIYDRADGVGVWGRTTLRFIRDDNLGGKAMLAMVEDIDEHVRTEDRMTILQAELRQSQKLEAVGLLAAGVAHDFNNRLGVIFGNVYLLKKRFGDDDQAVAWLETILSASRQAADLTGRLLDFSRKDETALGPVDLDEIVQNVAVLLEHSIDKRIRIWVDLRADEAWVHGDASQLQNMVFNLAVNAADAMGDGGDLGLTVEEADCPATMKDEEHEDREAGRRCLRITVSDTGNGIDPDVLPLIFDPFFTTKRAEKGTGLGLAAVLDTVRAHHGHVDVQSSPGEGSTFHVFLQRIAKGEAESAPSAAPALEGSGRILIIDDEPDILDVVNESLQASGYEVECCACPHEGIRRYREGPERFQLVLLDMVLPEMNGLQVFQALKEVDPDARVLVTSGYLASGTIQEVVDAGAIGFLKKPYDINELLRTISEAMPY
ncbi:MAG: PAS domain S-box protein [Planctomycetota bacterium]